MRRKNVLPAGTLFMALVIALGGLGIGYGLWTDLLEVNGTVATGEVDATFVLAQATEVAEFEGKDVGACTASIVPQEVTEPVIAGSGSAEQSLATDKVEIALTNAYPGYQCDIAVSVQNTGTIPIKLDALEVDNVGTPLTAGKVDVTFDDCWASGLQLHKDDTTVGLGYDCKIHFAVGQAAVENVTYEFVGTFTADQWNEYTAPPTAVPTIGPP